MNQFKSLTLNSEICVRKINNTTINNTNTEIRTNKMNNKKKIELGVITAAGLKRNYWKVARENVLGQ